MSSRDIASYFRFEPAAKRIEDLETPVPIIDIDIVERNLKRWQERCDRLGIANRPHIKTHKLVPLAKYQLALGAKGITVQKVGEAEVMADAGIRALDRADSVKILVGGLPQHPTPPLNYQIVYSLEGVLDYYTTPSWVVRDGEPVQVEALSEVESVDFPEPAGELEAFHTAGGLSTMPWTFKGRVRTMEYKTLRYPGHAEIMRAIRSLGLLGTDPIDVEGQPVVPRRVFIACAEPRLRRPGGRDLVALRVVAEGVAGGRPKRIVYELLDLYDEARGISAMERTTGYSLAITGQLQARGEVLGPGVRTPDQAVPAERYIEELAARGVEIRRRTQALATR